MYSIIGIVGLLFSLSFLSACAPIQNYTYTPPQGAPALKCIASCKVATNSCTQICALKNSTCRSEMEETATQRYTAYKMQRNAQSQPIKKGYNDFYRNASCTHSCNCTPSYNTCYSACGGRVYTN